MTESVPRGSSTDKRPCINCPSEQDVAWASYYRNEYRTRNCTFTGEQASAVCAALIQQGDMDTLAAFVHSQNFVGLPEMER